MLRIVLLLFQGRIRCVAFEALLGTTMERAVITGVY